MAAIAVTTTNRPGANPPRPAGGSHGKRRPDTTPGSRPPLPLHARPRAARRCDDRRRRPHRGGRILATRENSETIADSAAPVTAAAPTGDTRYDGGPEEGTRGALPPGQPASPLAGTRYDGGPQEGSADPALSPPRPTRSRRSPDSPARPAARNTTGSATTAAPRRAAEAPGSSHLSHAGSESTGPPTRRARPLVPRRNYPAHIPSAAQATALPPDRRASARPPQVAGEGPKRPPIRHRSSRFTVGLWAEQTSGAHQPHCPSERATTAQDGSRRTPAPLGRSSSPRAVDRRSPRRPQQELTGIRPECRVRREGDSDSPARPRPEIDVGSSRQRTRGAWTGQGRT
jgi:hypothetical protein